MTIDDSMPAQNDDAESRMQLATRKSKLFLTADG